MNGKLDNIEIKEAAGYINRDDIDYIVSKKLKFRYLY